MECRGGQTGIGVFGVSQIFFSLIDELDDYELNICSGATSHFNQKSVITKAWALKRAWALQLEREWMWIS